MTSEAEAVTLAIAGMALVTYATRAGGIWFMSLIRSPPRVEPFLRHLSSAVLAGLVAAATLRGDVATGLALGATVITMALTGRSLLAIAAGVISAALWRA